MTNTIEWSVTGTDRMEKCPECNGKGILVKNEQTIYTSPWDVTLTQEHHPCTKCEATGKINVVTEHVK